jgi:hypothetical protein
MVLTRTSSVYRTSGGIVKTAIDRISVSSSGASCAHSTAFDTRKMVSVTSRQPEKLTEGQICLEVLFQGSLTQ